MSERRQSVMTSTERMLGMMSEQDIGARIRIRSVGISCALPEYVNTPSTSTNDQRPQRAIERLQRTANVVLDMLEREGVEVVFGLPGGAVSPFYDALLDRPAIRAVTNKHESAAVFSAIGYARATGKLGVVLVTSGPGVLNALTAVASAHADGVPLLVIAGEVARTSQGKGALQEGSAYGINIVGMAQQITKLAMEVPEASSAPNLLRRAISTALSGRPGPCLLTFPLNVASGKVRVPSISQGHVGGHEIEASALDWVEKAMTRSRRAVIFAGSGLRAGNSANLLRVVAERLQCPVITTPKGKGVFPENHPLALGVFGAGGHPSASKYLEGGVETLLAIGTSMSELATNGWSSLLQPSRALIQVDIEASQIGRVYEPQLAITAPAEEFLGALASRLAPIASARAFGIEYHQDAETTLSGDDGRISPQRALWELQQILPDDTTYAIDSGEHAAFATHYLRADRPDTFMVMTGLGAMGASVAAALGAQLGHARRTVAAIVGDGGFEIGACELATAAGEKAGLVVAVFNHGGFDAEEYLYGGTGDLRSGDIDVDQVAAAFGAEVAVIEQPGEILGLEVSANTRTQPLVLDIRIDRQAKMPRAVEPTKLSANIRRPANTRRAAQS